MDEQDVLRHLLEVESNAASLVNDAQAEADKRVSENEKQNRSRFDALYNEEVSVLEKDYQENITKVKSEYAENLKSYQESFNSGNINTEAFTALVESSLFKGR